MSERIASGRMDYRVALYTMGCKTNQYDSNRLAAEFEAAGFQLVPFDAAADIYVINTCTVTAEADREARNASRRALARNPEALVIATGCYPQVNPEPMAEIPGVRLVGGNDLKRDLVARVRALLAEEGAPAGSTVESEPAPSRAALTGVSAIGRTRHVVKIQEGCNHRCAYCVVPHARGPARSRPVAEVVEEVRRVADAGFREVVLTGTCIGSYGKDFRPRVKLAECVAAVAAVPGLKRVRISSIEPWDVDDELIALVAGDPVVCAHFHLPLQSGDDGLRRRMRRAGTSAQFADLVARIRERLPDAGITTDVIVGFPGETDAEFEVTRDFCKRMQFSRMHIFRYSPRPFTHAATLPDRVPRAIANARSRVLIRMGEEMSQAFACRWVGRSVSVLVEGQNDPEDRFEGLTESYVRVLFTSERALARGELVNVEVCEAREGCLYGRVSGNE